MKLSQTETVQHGESHIPPCAPPPDSEEVILKTRAVRSHPFPNLRKLATHKRMFPLHVGAWETRPLCSVYATCFGISVSEK